MVTSAITKVTGGTLTEMTTEGLEQRITNAATEYLGTNPYKDVGVVALQAMVPGGTTGTMGATTDLIGTGEDVLEDAQSEFETIDPSPSKPISPTYTSWDSKNCR